MRLSVRKPSAKFRIVLLACLMVGISACATSPPYQEMSDARQAIALAEEAGAAEKSPRLFAQAQALLKRAKERINSICLSDEWFFNSFLI